MCFFFFFQAEDGIRDGTVTGVQTCALPICAPGRPDRPAAGGGAAPLRLPGCGRGQGPGDGSPSGDAAGGIGRGAGRGRGGGGVVVGGLEKKKKQSVGAVSRWMYSMGVERVW